MVFPKQVKRLKNINRNMCKAMLKCFTREGLDALDMSSTKAVLQFKQQGNDFPEGGLFYFLMSFDFQVSQVRRFGFISNRFVLRRMNDKREKLLME